MLCNKTTIVVYGLSRDNLKVSVKINAMENKIKYILFKIFFFLYKLTKPLTKKKCQTTNNLTIRR